MKFFTRVAFYFLIIGLFLIPLSYSYADGGDVSDEEEEILTLQEAAALVNSRDTAKDAVGGDVGSAYVEYYDLYSRQLSFREKSKIFRASLESRRVAFEAPRSELMDEHKEIERKVFAAETAAYQAYLQEMSEEGTEDDSGDDRQVISVKDGKAVEAKAGKAVEAKAQASGEEPHVKEISITENEPNGRVKKNIYMPEDAPDFDPENL